MTFFRPSNDDLLGDAKHDRTSEADSIPAIYNANARLSIEQQRVRLPIRFASSTFSSRALCCVCSLTRATPQQTQSSAERAALSRRDARHGRCGGRDRLRQVDTTAAVLARSRLDGRRSHDSSDAGEFCRVPFHSLFFSFFLLVDVCLIHLNFFVTTHLMFCFRRCAAAENRRDDAGATCGARGRLRARHRSRLRCAVRSLLQRRAHEDQIRHRRPVVARDHDRSVAGTFLRFCKFCRMTLLLLIALLKSRYSIVMVDEAHERHLDTDILLGLLKK